MVNISEHMYLLTAPPTSPACPASLHDGLLLSQDMCPHDVRGDSFQDLRRHGTGVLAALFDVSLAGDVPEGMES